MVNRAEVTVVTTWYSLTEEEKSQLRRYGNSYGKAEWHNWNQKN